MTEQKPREFWINLSWGEIHKSIEDLYRSQLTSDQTIHVVEFSALQAANAKIEKLRSALKNECVCGEIKRSGPDYRNVKCKPCLALAETDRE